ncbi:PTS sugar transporter subunit IIA [Lacticaseibacillus brantae]|uniref:Pts system protein, trehalose-specific n=1 Tax=Lacticaseibacillus brantae DSM 23927 TaxID=1423727 RepID=A0A0R2AWU9_9LACO|nr:PTS glucose transporter subunit IIA [Lacticaseibacillus brantae]KRM71447.1 pts system protein, trehalose-specific [Lacticaseibacillus brantae DSM 23927]
MFNFFKKHEKVDWTPKTFLAPADGEVVALANVSDPVFSQKAMGDGFGLTPSADEIYSPVSGTVTMVADTKHGIGITTEDGEEVLVHMGIDTVELKGAPFTVKVAAGDHIDAGAELAVMDRQVVSAAGKDTTIIVVVTNSLDKGWSVDLTASGTVEHNAVVATLK